MGETLTVRLFVRKRTYDLMCDANAPSDWLLQQANDIQNRQHFSFQEPQPFQALYNRTRNRVMDLHTPLHRNVQNMDVVYAKSLNQVQDCKSDANFWMKNVTKDSEVLFFQQLQAFAMIGKQTESSEPVIEQNQRQNAFLELLRMYILGSNRVRLESRDPHELVKPSVDTPKQRCVSLTEESASKPPSLSPKKLDRRVQGNQERVEPDGEVDLDFIKLKLPSPPPPVQQKIYQEEPQSQRQKNLDELDHVFDIVFRQHSIGMKLGADESKQHAIVRECLKDSEASKYPEIQHGTVILAVNGQEVSGIGLSKVLHRLREAPRPVVVRFGSQENNGRGMKQSAKASRWLQLPMRA